MVAGSYNVNADCTASLALTDASGNTENFAGVVVGQGTSALIFADGCGRGGQRFHAADLRLLPDVGSERRVRHPVFRGIGRSLVDSSVILDGQGNATATETRLNSGVISQVASTESIGNAACSATLTLTSLVDASKVNFQRPGQR